MRLRQKLLIVEDDESIKNSMILFLESEGYEVSAVSLAEEALETLSTQSFHCVLLDLGLPDYSGLKVLSWIEKYLDTPVIIITAEVDEQDVVKGLRMGAKDYIRKPFGLKELLARIEVLLIKDESEDILYFNQNNLSINKLTREVKINQKHISLTNNEYRLLKLLSTRPKQVFSRENLILGAFGYQYEGYERTVDTYIKTLRSKIEKDPKNPRYIKTVFGVGYQFIGDKDENV